MKPFVEYFPVSVASHTIDVSILPEAPRVLDVGCRHFDFAETMLYIRPQAQIVALDPDPKIEDAKLPGCEFRRVALVGDGPITQKYCSFSTGEGNYIGDSPVPQSALLDVFCIRIDDLASGPDGEPWDIVKLDCEGSEFAILENWPGPIAQQISVEFHDFKDRDKYSNDYFERLFDWMATKGYEVLQHPYTQVGEAWGHWDTLLRLRD